MCIGIGGHIQRKFYFIKFLSSCGMLSGLTGNLLVEIMANCRSYQFTSTVVLYIYILKSVTIPRSS
jgi:hypothetical protein